MSDSLPPMTDEELRAAADLLGLDFPGTLTRPERTAVIAAVFAAGRRLLNEVRRLNRELHGRRNLGVEYERLRVENIELAAKVEAVRKIKPQRRNSAMVTSEQLATMQGWNDAVDAIRAALNPCTCALTDPSTWETYGGATEPGSMYEWEPDCPAHGDAPEDGSGMPHAPAQDAQEPVSGSSGSTGVPNTPEAVQAVEEIESREWIAIPADDVDAWTIHAGLIGEVSIGNHRTSAHLTGKDIPLGAVLAFIADQQPEEDDEDPDLSLIPADLIKSDPGIRGGEPCITGTRIPASEVAGYLADGATWDEVREMLPSLPSLPAPSPKETP